MFDLQENLKKLPDLPGVYIHKDELGNVIYVGKAISLKNRVRQYFRNQKNMDPKVRAMVGHIAEFEYITCGTEMEALILECNLIKKYMPKYNVLLRDDKTYPYIKVTLNEEFPRIIKTRRFEKDGGKYYGPYTDVNSVNLIIEMLNNFYSLKQCATKSFNRDVKPCLNYHINQCTGVCSGKISKEEYMENLSKAMEFLSGKKGRLISDLKGKMIEASERLDFEFAAEYRDKIFAAETLSETQRVAIVGAGDMDLVLPVRTTIKTYIVMFSIRNGKLSEREVFKMQASQNDSNEELVAQFLMQHYIGISGDIIPTEIILDALPENSKMIEDCLLNITGKKIHLVSPQKGDKKAVLEMAKRDVIEMCKSIDEKAKNAEERVLSLNDELCHILNLAGYLGYSRNYNFRVEAYDISNTSGVDSVAGMVVFNGIRSVKKDYRRFKIKTVDGPDDYASLKETMYRRLQRLEKQDKGFDCLPDIIFVDGGKGQLSAVKQVQNAMNIDIPTFGMAKDDFHRTKSLVYMEGTEFKEIELADRRILFKYVATIQEEVHRFAIEYHRNLRDKKAVASILDNIEGIGPVKRNALLSAFGNIDAIKRADVESLMNVDGITEKLAEKIRKYFNC